VSSDNSIPRRGSSSNAERRSQRSPLVPTIGRRSPRNGQREWRFRPAWAEAPIIGGVSVFGGRGGTLGILGGVLLLTVIHVGLAIVYVPSFYVSMIGDILIFIAVAIDALRVNALGDA
jgi:predicted ABC-type sugar transport system permease subunit